MNITWDIINDYKDRGYVNVSRHPELPLSVVCYTRTVQFERAWDDVTKNARGLVVHDDGRIIGRGLPKFFAVGDPIAVIPPLDTFHSAFDKMDGSLIHVGEYEGELLIWTKGSFTTPHADAAREFLKGWRPNPGTTALFEGIFGSLNRVVVDYGDYRGLVLLGEVELESGKDWKHPEDVAAETGWGGDTCVERSGVALRDLVALTEDPENGDNREGFVMVWPREDAPAHRLKVKFHRYLTLHKLMTGLTPKRVFEKYIESLELGEEAGGELWEAFLEMIPDELDSAVEAIIHDINVQAAKAYTNAANWADVIARESTNRGEAAKHMANLPHDVRSLAWLLYDGKTDRAWLQAVRAAEVGSGMLMVLDDDG